MDNLSAHDMPDVNEWFDEHPRWTRHFTPKHASWLNQPRDGAEREAPSGGERTARVRGQRCSASAIRVVGSSR
jgi:hypothetical protein